MIEPSWVVKERDVSCGNFENEKAAASYFDCCAKLLEPHFEVLSERTVELGTPPIGYSQGKHTKFCFRPDRLLIPRDTQYMNERWNLGVVAVELKRSGEPIGPAWRQAHNYVGSRFFDSRLGLIHCVSTVFVFPFLRQAADQANYMNHFRVGVARPIGDCGVQFALASDVILNVIDNWRCDVNLSRLQFHTGSL